MAPERPTWRPDSGSLRRTTAIGCCSRPGHPTHRRSPRRTAPERARAVEALGVDHRRRGRLPTLRARCRVAELTDAVQDGNPYGTFKWTCACGWTTGHDEDRQHMRGWVPYHLDIYGRPTLDRSRVPKHDRGMSRRLSTFAHLLLVASIVVTLPGAASAHRLGGKWANPRYTYFTSSNGFGGFATQVDQAAAKWTNRSVFTISEGSATSAPVSVTIDTYGATDWIGVGIPGPNISSGTYTYGSIRLNASWTNDRHFNCGTPGGASCDYPADTDNQKECVASHEMGHVIGLAHTGDSPGYQAIMNPSHGKRCHTWALIGAQQHDTNDVAGFY